MAGAERWVTGSLITLPLFAAGVWAGEWITTRLGAGPAGRPGPLKRALVIALSVAAALIPLWFVRNKSDGQARAQALVTPHSHGSADLYWAAPGVIVALVCVCLVPAALWAARALTARLRRGRVATAGAPVTVLFVAAAVALAWLLDRTAQHAYASQVNYTRPLVFAPVHSHVFSGYRPRGAAVTAVPFALAYQLAHALQDGLAGQAAGLPAAAIALWWWARGRDPLQQANDTQEVARHEQIEPQGSAEDRGNSRSRSGDPLRGSATVHQR